MSKRGYIARYLLIIKKLNSKQYTSFKELESFIDSQVENYQYRDDTLDIGSSKRTFHRDKKEIKNLYGIDIEYSRKNKGYFINKKEGEILNFQRMIESFDIINSLELAHDFKSFIHLESRRPLGTENLYGILHAIKNRFKIIFVYQNFWDEEFSHRLVEPYALKEYRNRWYVIGKDENDNKIKTFALDRLSNLDFNKDKYQYPQNYSVEESFRYCFGVISPNDEKLEDIILSFTPFQGKYIKTLPLHHTQELLVDNEHETRIKLKLYPTHDFIMELLSFGNNVIVIEPQSLAEKIQEEHEKAFKRYTSSK